MWYENRVRTLEKGREWEGVVEEKAVLEPAHRDGHAMMKPIGMDMPQRQPIGMDNPRQPIGLDMPQRRPIGMDMPRRNPFTLVCQRYIFILKIF